MKPASLYSIGRTALLAFAVAAALGGPSASAADGKSTAVSGSFTATYTKRDAVPVNDADGHVIMLTVAEGTQSSKTFMDGATVANRELADLVQGNGPHDGYCSFTKGADGVVVKWHGRIATTLNPDKTPRTTLKGTWTYVAGAGQYAGIKGKGSYSGVVISENAYKVDWKGAYAIDRASMSTK